MKGLIYLKEDLKKATEAIKQVAKKKPRPFEAHSSKKLLAAIKLIEEYAEEITPDLDES